MKRFFLLFLGISFSISLLAQEDWGWWNELHGWEPGMPSWRSFVIISPGYLGPNALPVPEVKKGILDNQKHVEFGADFHFRDGDPTQNISGNLYYPFADGKIAIELYGVMLEHYAMSAEVRNERRARDYDGKGLAIGDLYFSTLIQLSKDKRFPSTLFRMVGKTASGGRLDAARYADSPGYFFDLSFSKRYGNADSPIRWLPFLSGGFYSWQTNDDMNLQNDAFMYAAGIELDHQKWKITNSLSGYSGYKNERDKPFVYTLDIVRKLNNNDLRIQFINGLRDWEYKTFKISYSWKWN
ncbi:hypothetical protein ACUNWD_15850 [Sunxiuqinia sp. A32]|uniref:hypothetical protein n=1 Tax=Sunxiuqinia sp. A32 TaxID=3461496 RepID=UPI00404557A7